MAYRVPSLVCSYQLLSVSTILLVSLQLLSGYGMGLFVTAHPMLLLSGYVVVLASLPSYFYARLQSPLRRWSVVEYSAYCSAG